MDQARDVDLIEGGSEGTAKRACDQCRLRKIRCDKDSPCSNCRTAKRSCSSSGVGQRSREPRSRVLISSQYERKIDFFEARLAGIEGMLRDLTVSLTGRSASGSMAATDDGTSPAPSSRHGSSPMITDHVNSGGYDNETNDANNDADSAFEGDSSMAAQTVYASAFLHDAVKRTALQALHPDMEAALQSLQQIAAMQNGESTRESRFENAIPMPKGGFRSLPMPPSQFVLNLLRSVKERPPRSFSLTWILTIAPDLYTERARMVYFPTEDYSLILFAQVNGGLYFLMRERAIYEDGERRDELLRYQAMCQINFETACVNLPLLMPSRKESIELLLMASTYAVEMSKFTLAWRFNITAATICQTLGYHRAMSAEAAADPRNEIRILIFWFCYAFDKAFSLRFGRNSMIQDYDITAPRELGSNICLPDPAWRAVFMQWTTHAEFIGKAYEQLFSPAALTRPPHLRAESARELICKLDDLMRRVGTERDAAGFSLPGSGEPSLNDPNNPNPFSLDMAAASDDVMFYATMALVYRAIPNETGSGGSLHPGCIDAARRAFERHDDCMNMTSDNLVRSGYIHWTILYIPFVPVIVLFCHVIETYNAADLQRLSAFANSLQPVCAVSKATERFYRVCQVLYNVARLYLEAKAEQDEQMNLVGNDMDMYLSQLGFMPQQFDPSAHTAFNDGSLPQAAQLGNWLSGSGHILGLVEGDLAAFDPGMWNHPHP